MRVTPEAAFSAALAPFQDTKGSLRLGAAVSGGGDSMALLHLAADWSSRHGHTLCIATVDHGLRPEAASEAELVARACAALGVSHDILHWKGWDGRGNLQAAARDARRRLLTAWAKAKSLDHVLLGHTADDEAETVLMRLARGSGVDGLAGMEAAGPRPFLRPLLDVGRAELRRWLKERGVAWAEDPSNQETRFDRVKARRALAALEPLGLTVERLRATAAHMRRARLTLWQAARDYARRHVIEDRGDLLISEEAMTMAGDSPGRLFAAALMWIGAGAYRPRYAALSSAIRAVGRGETRTIAGVRMEPHGGGARLARELAAVEGPVRLPAGAMSARWDGRWVIEIDNPQGFPAGLHVAALGQGIAKINGWRDAGLPRASLMASPAVWRDERLIAALLVGSGRDRRARLDPTFGQFLRRQ